MIYTNRVKIAEQAYSSLSSEAQECLCKWAKEFGSNFPSGAGYTNRNESRQTVLKMICPCAYPEFPRRGKQTQASMESYNSEALASRSANVFWLMKDQILRYELKLANILRKNKFQENQHGIWECLSKEARLKYTSSWLNHKYRIVRSNGDLQIHQTRTKVISQSQSLCELSFIVTLNFFDITDKLGLELGCLLYSSTAPEDTTKNFSVDGAMFFPQVVTTSCNDINLCPPFDRFEDVDRVQKHLGWHRIGWMHSHNRHDVTPTLHTDVPHTFTMMFDLDSKLRPLMLISNEKTKE